MIAAQEILGLSEGAFVAIMVALIGGPIVAWVTTRGAKREARAARQEAAEVRRSVGEQNGHGTVQDATGVILDRLDSMARAQHSMQTSLDAVVAESALWALRFLPGESMQCVISSLGSLTEGDLAGVKLTMQFKAAPALLRVQD